ncbi:MAG: hypothetical protein Q8M54_01530, partial [Desulfobaccales bacterium]|nr:hypothetical protein [Desulfobaccales bacterium]
MRAIFLMILLATVAPPDMALAQMPGQAGGQHMKGHGMMGQGQGMMDQGMAGNLGIMSNMMRDMQQMMGQGQMSPEHQRQMLDLMNQMGGMMQEMCG